MNTFDRKKEADPIASPNGVDRRNFLKYAGITAGAATLLVACKKDDDEPTVPTEDQGQDLGSGDIGILNYAYALEQLEAAFYTRVVASVAFVNIFSAAEQSILTDIRDHEIVHREFFKAALAGNAIPALEVNFDTIDFQSRASVLATARTFEDLGVAAYNGAGKLLTNATYLMLAGKIVSVEARHASAIRDLLSTAPLNSPDFSGDDVVNPANGLDRALCPAEVLAAAGPYIRTKINASNLPTC